MDAVQAEERGAEGADVDALQAQLRGSVQIQLENMRDGMRLLGTGPDRLRDAADALTRVVELCVQSEGLIDNYALIKQVSRTQQNFAVAHRVYDELRALDARVERSAAMLDADVADCRASFGEDGSLPSSPLGAKTPDDQRYYGARHMLLVGMHVARTAQFRTQTLEMMRGAAQTATYSLQRYFRRADALAAAFHDHVRSYPRRLLALAAAAEAGREHARSALVALSAVLLRLPGEERARFYAALDEAVALRVSTAVIQAVAAARASRAASPTTLAALSPTSPGMPSGVEAAGDDPSAALEGLSAVVVPDLCRVRSQIAPRFAPALAILDQCVLLYHRHVCAAMAAVLAGPSRPPSSPLSPTKPSTPSKRGSMASSPKSGNQAAKRASIRAGETLAAPDILYVLGWAQAYHDELAAALGIAPDHLEPALLPPGAEAALADRYVSSAGALVATWTNNLLDRVVVALRTRSEPPDTDAHERYTLAYGLDLFQIVRQHTEMAAQSASPRVVAGVLSEASKALASFQRGVVDAVGAEAARARAAPDAVPDLLEAYVIAVGNTALRWVTLQTDLAESAERMLGAEHAAVGARVLRPLADGWVGLARACCSALADIVMDTVRPALAQLFAPAWYGRETPLMATIVVTVEDFTSDWAAHADPVLIGRVVAELAERLCVSYIASMRAKGSRLRPAAGLAVYSADDMATLTSWLSRARDPERARRALDPLARWTVLVSAGPKMLAMDFVSFHKAVGGDAAALPLFEEVLRARDDLRAADVREIVGAVRRRIADEPPPDESSASIFAKALAIVRH